MKRNTNDLLSVSAALSEWVMQWFISKILLNLRTKNTQKQTYSSMSQVK